MTPVVLAGAMAAVFQQALALLMGLVGPAMVVGSWYESRRHAAQKFDREVKEYETALVHYQGELAQLRSREKATALALLPSLAEAVGQPLWRRAALSEHGCRIGLGRVSFPEGHPLWGSPDLWGMPTVLDAQQGVTLVGDKSCAGTWRTIAVSWALESGIGLRLDGRGELPREVSGSSQARWVGRIEDVPEDCRVVVVCSDKPTVEVIHSGVSVFHTIPDQLSHAEALWILRTCGLLEEPSLDSSARSAKARDQVWCSLAESTPQWDLVREGPHVVVWGATGSGKSVTVTSLIQSLATRYTPEELVCVLIDFKGGAGLRPLQALPHIIGSMTDMEGVGVSRALVGLHSELLRREKILHAHGVSDISGLHEAVNMPRLVVVIDEAAWLLTNFPEFHTALADVLARGRSLGVHVVISTQRVTGVLSASMMANISLRICGRVSDEHDALSWIPDVNASLREKIRHLQPGEVIFAGASAKPSLQMVAPARDGVAKGTPSRWRVWADPLPRCVEITSACWAVADDVPAQSHRLLAGTEAPRGSTLVVGDAGSGKTTTLATLGTLWPGAEKAPHHPLLLWLWWKSHDEARPVVLDDLDVTLDIAGADGAHLLLELFQSNRGPLLMATRPESVHYRSLSRLGHSSLIHSVAKRELREVVGGESCLIPGRARYRDETIHVACGASNLCEPEIDYVTPDRGSCVITRSPERWAGAPVSLVLPPEELARRWLDLADRTDIIVDRIAPVEVRSATLGRLHPPPLPVPEDVLLVWRDEEFHSATRAWWKG